MRTETATNAKNHFGAIMDAALREPVLIQRSGRDAVMMVSSEYKEMIEDKIWGEMAMEAKKEKPIGIEETAKFFESIMNARG